MKRVSSMCVLFLCTDNGRRLDSVIKTQKPENRARSEISEVNIRT